MVAPGAYSISSPLLEDPANDAPATNGLEEDCSDASGLEAAWTEPAQDEEELLRREAELTKKVPELLEVMNSTAIEVNALDKQLAATEARIKELSDRFETLNIHSSHSGGSSRTSGLHGGHKHPARLSSMVMMDSLEGHLGSDDVSGPGTYASEVSHPMLSRSSSSSAPHRGGPSTLEDSSDPFRQLFDRARCAAQNFEASEVTHAKAKAELRCLEQALEACGSLSAEQQEELSESLAKVMRCQQERDHLEQEHLKALADLRQAARRPDSADTSVAAAYGQALLPSATDLAVRMAKKVISIKSPRQRAARQLKAEMTSLQQKVATLAQQAKAAKKSYSASVEELGRISSAVHEQRTLMVEADKVTRTVFGAASPRSGSLGGRAPPPSRHNSEAFDRRRSSSQSQQRSRASGLRNEFGLHAGEEALLTTSPFE